MSRLSTANALWSQLIGGGTSNAGTRQAVRQHSRALPITPEVIAEATRGMGTEGRKAYMRQLLGGQANPFVNPPGLATPDEYGYIEMNGEVVQDKPGRTAVEQEKLAQLIQQKMNAEQRARALGTIAGRTGADAQAARQELGIPMSPGYEDLISPEQDRVLRTRIAEEAGQRSQIEKFAKQPGATQSNIDELWQQHSQQFPEFANGQRPRTRTEQLEQMKAAKLATYQQAVGDVPLDYDDKGQIQVIPGFAEAQRAKAEAAKYQYESRTDEYRRQSEILRDAYPDGGAKYIQERINLHKQFFGDQQQPQAPPAPPEQGSSLPVNRAQFDTYRQQAQAAGVELVADQDDYDSIDTSQGPVRFLDIADGQIYEKPQQ